MNHPSTVSIILEKMERIRQYRLSTIIPTLHGMALMRKKVN